MRSEGVGLVFVLADRAPRLGIILQSGRRSVNARSSKPIQPPHRKEERRA